MSVNRSPDDLEMALLSAFLDGELSPKDEASLLATLAQRPDLQDALDDLADQIAAAQTAFRNEDESSSLISARVMAELDPAALPADRDAAETLASLAKDGASTAAQARRLDEMVGNDARLADAVASFIAAADVSRAAVAVDDQADVLRSLATLPDHVLARVERTERGWALSMGAIDGQLNAAETNELAGLCGADDDLFASLYFQMQHGLHAGEALRAAADSPAFLQYAEKAGAAALQAIAALQVNEAARPATAATKTTTTVTRVTTVTWAVRARTWLSQSAAPLFAATAALVAFIVIGKSEPVTTAHPEPGGFASLQQAFVDVVQPLLLADNRAVPNGELAVIVDNAADVEAIDATSTTMVFSTSESNITVIWVAGLEDDDESAGSEQKEQGT